jgi:hypothetical protein
MYADRRTVPGSASSVMTTMMTMRTTAKSEEIEKDSKMTKKNGGRQRGDGNAAEEEREGGDATIKLRWRGARVGLSI